MNLLDPQLTPTTPAPHLFSSYLRGESPDCPICGYSLRGLPESHRCPECGFEYDLRTQIWRSDSDPRRLLEPLMPALVLFSLIAICAILLRGWMDTKSWVLAAAMSLWFAVILKPFVCRLKKPYFVVGVQGLIYRLRNRVEVIPWSEISEAWIERGLGRAFLCCRGQGQPRRINLSIVLEDVLRIRACEAAIQHELSAHRAAFGRGCAWDCAIEEAAS